MIDILLKFTQKAGRKLKSMRKNVKTMGNKDSSVSSLVTQADVYISDIFAKTVKKHFSHLSYMIIDEEKITNYGKDIFNKIKSTEYQFVIDPIDGTIQYANNHPLYGITIGVYKNAKPLMGLIYLPEIEEMIYFDGKKAYYVQNCFKKNEIKTELLPQAKADTSIIFGHPWLWDLTSEFSTDKALFLDYFASVSQCFYSLLSKAKGYCMWLYLWDIAGTLPIAEYLGIKLYKYGSNKACNGISPDFFDSDMGLKDLCVMCHSKDYKEICSMVCPKKQ